MHYQVQFGNEGNILSHSMQNYSMQKSYKTWKVHFGQLLAAEVLLLDGGVLYEGNSSTPVTLFASYLTTQTSVIFILFYLPK